jgi:hypothetical protein
VQESVAQAPEHIPKKPDAPAERERVELPTNESSEQLLKIRHTVSQAFLKDLPGVLSDGVRYRDILGERPSCGH